MDLPYRVLWLEEGGYIARYSAGGPNGHRWPYPEIGNPSSDSPLDNILAAIEDPSRQIWSDPGPDGPERVYFMYIDENQLK